MVLTRAKAAAIVTPAILMAPLWTQVTLTFTFMMFMVMSAAANDWSTHAYQKSLWLPLEAVRLAQHFCLKIPFPQVEAQVPT